MTMTPSERERLRKLQDHWLALGVVKANIRNFGEDNVIAGPHSPTYRLVRSFLLPEWEEWFRDFFQ